MDRFWPFTKQNLSWRKHSATQRRSWHGEWRAFGICKICTMCLRNRWPTHSSICCEKFAPGTSHLFRNGVVLKRKMVLGRSAPVIHEGVSAREDLQNTHGWCRCKLSAFREKRMLPGSSSNLNPTQKLQGIPLQELESWWPFISLRQLTEQQKSVWANIFGDTA